MAKVKDQSIPTDQFEDTLDPPIDFKDQYRRALSEGIDHPKLPPGEEIVTFSKKESRPAQRSDSPYYNKPVQQAWRNEFSSCLECWKSQYATEAEIEACHSAGSKHYVEPWYYVPGAKPTYFAQFMSACLNWAKTNPGTLYPKCEDLVFSPEHPTYCPNSAIEIIFTNGTAPYAVTPSAGSVDANLIWHAPALWDDCPELVTFEAVDADGRKGCSEISKVTFALLYDSLIMGCDEEQIFQVNPDSPGCPPYVWELSGGGELIDNEDGSATYTSPPTNPNCVSNPTITLTDDVGNTTQVKLAVNCYNYGTAYTWYFWSRQPFYDVNCPPSEAHPTGVCGWDICADLRKCDGALSEHCNPALSFYKQCQETSYSGSMCCLEGGPCEESNCGPECGWMVPKFLIYNGGSGNSGHPNNSVEDIRTEEMKAAGCCPLNPITGLPF